MSNYCIALLPSLIYFLGVNLKLFFFFFFFLVVVVDAAVFISF